MVDGWNQNNVVSDMNCLGEFMPEASSTKKYSNKGRFQAISFKDLNLPTNVLKILGPTAN